MKNVLYFAHINSIGGVETFYWYLVQAYPKADITIYYKTGDVRQVERLREFVPVIKYAGEQIKCEKIFFNYAADIINNVEAEEYIQIIHADYRALGINKPRLHAKITKYIGVSQTVCDAFEEVTGKTCELCYNPIALPKPNKMLRLISATRLTEEKTWWRYERFARALDDAGVSYTWEIFTDRPQDPMSPNVFFRPTRLNILDNIKSADYLVQLSETEGYCFSVVEALSVGTPVIVTNCPVYDEIGLNATNSIRLDMDLTSIPISKIKKGLKSFKYEPPKDRWGELLASGGKRIKPERVKMICVSPYYDFLFQRNIQKGETFTVSRERGIDLINAYVAKEVQE